MIRKYFRITHGDGHESTGGYFYPIEDLEIRKIVNKELTQLMKGRDGETLTIKVQEMEESEYDDLKNGIIRYWLLDDNDRITETAIHIGIQIEH